MIFLTSCNQKKEIPIESIVEKVLLIERPTNSMISNIWNTTDGIKIITGDKTEYFLIDIEIPPCCQRGSSEIRFCYQLFSSDSLRSEKNIEIPIDNGFYPVYCNNTLNVINVKNIYGAYFFAFLDNPLGGLDPKILVMWVYYKEQIYKFEGVVPQHQDWLWDETYSFKPDKKLKAVSEEAYNKIVVDWERYIQKYKEYYEKH